MIPDPIKKEINNRLLSQFWDLQADTRTTALLDGASSPFTRHDFADGLGNFIGAPTRDAVMAAMQPSPR